MATHEVDLRKLLEEGLYTLVGLSIVAVVEARRRLRATGSSPGVGDLASGVRRSLLEGADHLEQLVGDRVAKQASARAGALARDALGAIVRRIA